MDNNRMSEIVVDLCNVVLQEKPASMPELTIEEWDEVLTFAARQGVLPILSKMLAEYEAQDPQTRKVLVRWYVKATNNQKRYQLRLKTMRQIARLFAEEGIDIMFMKGAALAQLYPAPEWRVFSDIDYYLYGKSEQGMEAMAKYGIVNSAYYHHHTQASLNGVLLENHYDFVERVNHSCDIILDDALKQLAEKEGRSMKASFLGEKVNNAYLMTPTMNAIFLMRHMSAHFVSETIPLRMLYDWALFLKHYAKDVDWPLVTDLYDKSGMTEFAGLIQHLLRTRLGMECAECPIFQGKEEKVDRLWDSIINPPAKDPHKKYSFKYYLFETRTFWSNRWKHRIVYPGESYTMLFLKYSKLGVKKMLGLLK